MTVQQNGSNSIYEATEIDTLRSGIDSQLITDTNTVKEEKSQNELFVWSYEHTEKSNASTKQRTQNVQKCY